MENQLIGIENEFELFRNGKDGPKLNAEGYIKRLVKLGGKPFFEKSHSAFRIWTGGSLYSDTGDPEIATPPIMVRKGCIRQAVNSLVQNRNNLVELVERFNEKYADTLWLKGYSTHCNFSEEEPSELILRIAKSAAAPVLLLLEQRNSLGMMLRDKYDRLELCGDYIASPEQMKAAMAFIYGMLRGIKRGIKLKMPNFNSLWAEPTIGGELTRMKRTSHVRLGNGKVSLQELLEHYFKIFREDIGKIAEDEVGLLEEYISGKRKLEADSENFPEGYCPVCKVKQNPFQLPKLAAAFSRASECKERISGILLRTESMSWDAVDYSISFLNGKPIIGMDDMIRLNDFMTEDYIVVNREDLVAFYKLLDSTCIGEEFKKASPEKRKEMLMRLSQLKQA